MKRSVDDLSPKGQRVLVRLDLNVPLDGSAGITDDRRIRAALPTVKKLLEGQGRLVLMSHLGRPDEEPEQKHKYTLAPVAKRLGELLGKNVVLLSDCVGTLVKDHVTKMHEGDLCLLENLRFHEEETIKDKKAKENPELCEKKDAFAKQIADLGDAYVNDAFGTCHRDNASMLTVPKLMVGKPRVVGYLVQKELKYLGGALKNPKRPFVCILGGAKVSDKLGVIRSLLTKCDTILIGGAMAYTFLAAEGLAVGKSLVEPDLFDTARSLRKEAGDRLKLPVDSVVAVAIAEYPPPLPRGAERDREGSGSFPGQGGFLLSSICESAIPCDKMGLDIGPKTITAYAKIVGSAGTVVWNGPMGVFETPPFDTGTVAVARALADATARGAITIVGGGDSAAAVDQAGLADQISHISTGGGASLGYLEGKPFAPLDVLDDA